MTYTIIALIAVAHTTELNNAQIGMIRGWILTVEEALEYLQSIWYDDGQASFGYKGVPMEEAYIILRNFLTRLQYRKATLLAIDPQEEQVSMGREIKALSRAKRFYSERNDVIFSDRELRSYKRDARRATRRMNKKIIQEQLLNA